LAMSLRGRAMRGHGGAGHGRPWKRGEAVDDIAAPEATTSGGGALDATTDGGGAREASMGGGGARESADLRERERRVREIWGGSEDVRQRPLRGVERGGRFRASPALPTCEARIELLNRAGLRALFGVKWAVPGWAEPG
jgi:hypothetical protein